MLWCMSSELTKSLQLLPCHPNFMNRIECCLFDHKWNDLKLNVYMLKNKMSFLDFQRIRYLWVRNSPIPELPENLFVGLYIVHLTIFDSGKSAWKLGARKITAIFEQSLHLVKGSEVDKIVLSWGICWCDFTMIWLCKVCKHCTKIASPHLGAPSNTSCFHTTCSWRFFYHHHYCHFVSVRSESLIHSHS